jgi:hypothetical protein
MMIKPMASLNLTLNPKQPMKLLVLLNLPHLVGSQEVEGKLGEISLPSSSYLTAVFFIIVSSFIVDLVNDFVVFLYQKDAYMQLKSTTKSSGVTRK